MNLKQALKEGGTRFAVYVTIGNRHYFSHSDGYRWELIDGKLVHRTKALNRISNDRWEPVYADDGIYPDLLAEYEKLVPPNIPAAPNGQPTGQLTELLTVAISHRDFLGQLANTIQDDDFLDPDFRTNLDELITTATALRKML